MKFFTESLPPFLPDFRFQGPIETVPGVTWEWTTSAAPIRIVADHPYPWEVPAIVQVKVIEGKNRERTLSYPSSYRLKITTEFEQPVSLPTRSLTWVADAGKFFCHSGPIAVGWRSLSLPRRIHHDRPTPNSPTSQAARPPTRERRQCLVGCLDDCQRRHREAHFPVAEPDASDDPQSGLQGWPQRWQRDGAAPQRSCHRRRSADATHQLPGQRYVDTYKNPPL